MEWKMVCENSEVKIGSKSAFVMLFNLQKELTKTTLELCLFYQWAGLCGSRQLNVKSTQFYFRGFKCCKNKLRLWTNLLLFFFYVLKMENKVKRFKTLCFVFLNDSLLINDFLWSRWLGSMESLCLGHLIAPKRLHQSLVWWRLMVLGVTQRQNYPLNSLYIYMWLRASKKDHYKYEREGSFFSLSPLSPNKRALCLMTTRPWSCRFCATF